VGRRNGPLKTLQQTLAFSMPGAQLDGRHNLTQSLFAESAEMAPAGQAKTLVRIAQIGLLPQELVRLLPAGAKA
jgi:hypothetical protein